MRSLAILSCSALAFALVAREARADDLAPELERAELHAEAQAEVASQLAALPADERRRLVGTYAAIDPNPTDPFAQVACDDDGDHVVVLSEAMLTLVAHVARALRDDEAAGSRKADDYAVFLARSQRPGRRLLLPPPGFYGVETPNGNARAREVGTAFDARFHDVLSFVVGRELARLRASDLVCPRPTPTKESGDAVWSDSERRKAAEVAAITYPGHQAERDDAALALLVERGRSEKGAFGLLHFFARLEAEARDAGAGFVPGYIALHPSSATRASDLAKAAANRAAPTATKDDATRVR